MARLNLSGGDNCERDGESKLRVRKRIQQRCPAQSTFKVVELRHRSLTGC